MGFKRTYKLIKDWLYVGRGINLRKSPLEEVDVYLSLRNTHLLGLGRTRWGKTQFIRRCVIDDIERGLSVVVIDPKGDYDLLEGVLDACLKTNREDDFIFFTLVNPEVSVKINPFAGLSPEAIGSTMKAIAPAEDKFFADVCYYIATGVAYALKSLGKEELRAVDFFQYTTLESLKELLEKVREEGKETSYIKDAILSLEKLASREPKHFSKVSIDYEMALHKLSTGVVGELFGKVYGNPLRERLINRKPVIFYAYLGALSPETGEDVVAITSRLILSSLEKVYGYYYDRNWKFHPPIAEYVDEAKQVFYQGMENKLAIAGGLNVYIHMFTQSERDLVSKLGKLAGVFFDNTNWVIFSIRDDEVAKKFEQGSGKKERYKPLWNKDDFVLVREKEPLIPADHFKRTPKGVAHADIEGSWYRVYSPMIEGVRRIKIKEIPYDEERIRKAVKGSEELKISELQNDGRKLKELGLIDIEISLKDFPYMQKTEKQEQRHEVSKDEKQDKKQEKSKEDNIELLNTLKTIKQEEWNKILNPKFCTFKILKKGNLVYVDRKVAKSLKIDNYGKLVTVKVYVNLNGKEVPFTKMVYEYIVPGLEIEDANVKIEKISD